MQPRAFLSNVTALLPKDYILLFFTSIFLIALSLVVFLNFSNSWFALTLFFFYEAANITGIAILPWIYCGELFSTSQKEVGIGISTCYNYILCFLVLKFNLVLVLSLQPAGAFLFYGLLTLIGSIILYFILPDTRNKTLKEIEVMFPKR